VALSLVSHRAQIPGSDQRCPEVKADANAVDDRARERTWGALLGETTVGTEDQGDTTAAMMTGAKPMRARQGWYP